MNIQSFTPKQLSASGNAVSGDGIMSGVFCSSSSSGTLTIYDDAATGTTNKIVDTFPLVAGTFYPLPIAFSAGLNLVVGGTASFTLLYVRG